MPIEKYMVEFAYTWCERLVGEEIEHINCFVGHGGEGGATLVARAGNLLN